MQSSWSFTCPTSEIEYRTVYSGLDVMVNVLILLEQPIVFKVIGQNRHENAAAVTYSMSTVCHKMSHGDSDSTAGLLNCRTDASLPLCDLLPLTPYPALAADILNCGLEFILMRTIRSTKHYNHFNLGYFCHL